MTLATIRSYGKLLNQLVAHAVTDVEQITKRLDTLGSTAVKNGLTLTFGHILEPYRQATGLLAARYLSETIVSKYGGQLYIPPGVEPIAKGQIAASVNWAITGSSSTDQLIRKLGGTTTRLVLGAARDTTSNNVELLNGTDYFGQTLRIGWQRFPLPGCCDFCAMIASRGPVYKTLESATTVVGRGSNRTGYDSNGVRLTGGIGGGVVARGNKPLGSKYHDSCKCVVAPVYEGDDWSNDWAERFMDRYTGKVTREQEAAVAATIAWNSPKAIEIRNSVGKSGNKSSTGGGKPGSGSANSGGSGSGGGKPPIPPNQRPSSSGPDDSNKTYFVVNENGVVVRYGPFDPKFSTTIDYLPELPKALTQLPDGVKISQKTWKHILYADNGKGGHLYGSGGKAEFPAHWSPNDIADAIHEVLQKNNYWLNTKETLANITGSYKGIDLAVTIRKTKSGYSINTAWPVGKW